MRDYQESVTTGQTHRQTDRQTDPRQSDPYVPLCFAGDTKAMRDYHESVTTKQTHGQRERQTPDKVIPMCRYALQATQKVAIVPVSTTIIILT